MLELPYLEICAEIFERRFKNSVLQKIAVQPGKFIAVSLTTLNENLLGKELKKVWREGLCLRFQFMNYAILEMSLSSSASLQVLEGKPEADAGLLTLSLSGGQVLSIKDAQSSSRFRLNPTHESVPDVLSKEMTYEFLLNLVAHSEQEIKYLMMNQHLIRGIGEAYADEILWYSEISPFSILSKIPPDKVKVLHKTMKYVLLDAVKQMRKINALIFDKGDSDLLMIHSPDRKNSPTGKPIIMKAQQGIETYYTDEQVLYD